MEYQKKPITEARSVKDIIKEQNSLLDKMINKTDKYWHGWAENLPEGKILVQFCGSFPIQCVDDVYLFQRLQISQYARKGMSEISETSTSLLKQLLEEIKLNRVYDEDGCNGIFSKQIKDGDFVEADYAYCYVNSLIPEGYWENHLLETHYVDFS